MKNLNGTVFRIFVSIKMDLNYFIKEIFIDSIWVVVFVI